MKKKSVALLLPIVVTALVCGPSIKASPNLGSTAKAPTAYWPTSNWRTALPEQEGMNAAKLADLFSDIQNKKMPVDGIVITRNGYIVAENYYNGSSVGNSHLIHSVTKSITGAALGVAIQDKLIPSVNTRVLDYFKNRKIKNFDINKKKITFKQLLTMSEGLDWPEESKDFHTNNTFMNDHFYNADDPVQSVLDRPVKKNQIGVFNYNTGDSELISAVIQSKSGERLSDYVWDKIFSKIGIGSSTWPTDNAGYSYGGTAVSLTARDMAKFGYLYLKNGAWDGKQVIPKTWVKASTSAQVKSTFPGVSYGYFWWVQKLSGHPMYEAMGAFGQYIAVVPDLGIVVSLTSQGQDVDTLLQNYIIPAATSSKPIPYDPAADARLKRLTQPQS